jgi:hypothetical protein
VWWDRWSPGRAPEPVREGRSQARPRRGPASPTCTPRRPASWMLSRGPGRQQIQTSIWPSRWLLIKAAGQARSRQGVTLRCQTWLRPLSLVEAFCGNDGCTVSAHRPCARHLQTIDNMAAHVLPHGHKTGDRAVPQIPGKLGLSVMKLQAAMTRFEPMSV